MTTADLIDSLDSLFTRGATISEWKPRVIDIRDQAVAIDKTFAEFLARNETLVAELEIEQLRNTALRSVNLELDKALKQAKVQIDELRLTKWNERADLSNPPATYEDDGF